MIAQTSDDKVKIEEYRKTLGKYAKPSVTADIVAFRPAYSELQAGQWRENPVFSLEVLLIKRDRWPYEGAWALPGGFIHQGGGMLPQGSTAGRGRTADSKRGPENRILDHSVI